MSNQEILARIADLGRRRKEKNRTHMRALMGATTFHPLNTRCGLCHTRLRHCKDKVWVSQYCCNCIPF